MLGRTEEWVELPDDIVARIEGKSSLGRLGLIVHATAGFVDPGFKGTLTLEITNFNSVPIVLRTGLPIAQLSLMALDRPPSGPTGTRSWAATTTASVDATESRYEGGPAPTAGSRPNGGRLIRSLPEAAVTISTVMDFSLWQIAIVLVIALIVFGPKRLPELGKSLGTGMREFKDSITGDNDDDEDEKREEQAKLEVQAAAPQPREATEPAEAEVVAEPKA